MPLTPTDVHNVAFSKPPIGKRGYHEDEVDTFLDLVGAELARLIEENKNLRDQLEHLDRQRRVAPIDTGRTLRPPRQPWPVVAPGMEQTPQGNDHQAQAVKILGLAQEIADRVTGDARTEADGMVSNARTTSARLLSEARAKADGMVNEARTRAETVLNDARTSAEALDRQSRENAASLEREAARKHNEIIGSISQEKRLLEMKIDELRTFEREYRTRLKIYLDAQVRELDSRGAAASANTSLRDRQGFGTSGFGPPTGSGNHPSGPQAGKADEAKSSALSGPRDRAVSDAPGTNGTRWKPAVALDDVGAPEGQEIDPWTPAQRSVS